MTDLFAQMLKRAGDFAAMMVPKQRKPDPQKTLDDISRAMAYRYAFTSETPEMTPMERARYDAASKGSQPEAREHE